MACGSCRNVRAGPAASIRSPSPAPQSAPASHQSLAISRSTGAGTKGLRRVSDRVASRAAPLCDRSSSASRDTTPLSVSSVSLPGNAAPSSKAKPKHSQARPLRQAPLECHVEVMTRCPDRAGGDARVRLACQLSSVPEHSTAAVAHALPGWEGR